MQAADFIAWEMRKAYLNMKAWHALSDRPMADREAQWNHFLEWTRELTGKDPVLRKSLDALLAQLGINSNSVVWDYAQLVHTHEIKGGIWIRRDGE